MAIAYAEHPISKAQKVALRKQGFDKVIDIRFAPSELANGDKKIPKKKKEKDAEAQAIASHPSGAPVSLDTGLPA